LHHDGEMENAAGNEHQRAETPAADGPSGRPEKPPASPRPGFLELIYGVLFEPAAVMRRVAADPPFGTALLIFTLVNLIDALMSAVIAARAGAGGLPGTPLFARSAVSVMIAVGLILQYVKWFAVSALVHLTAGLLGGRGRAVGLMTVTALAVLPAVLLVPVNLILLLFGVRSVAPVMLLLGLAVLVWSAGLVVLGLREEYGLNTARALLAVLLPPAALLVVAVILILIMAVGAAAVFPFANIPRY